MFQKASDSVAGLCSHFFLMHCYSYRDQLSDALKEKGLPPVKKKALEKLSTKLISFTTKTAIPRVSLSPKDLWKQRQKQIVTNCFHKMGIVVPYDKKTELGYRSLTVTDRE